MPPNGHDMDVLSDLGKDMATAKNNFGPTSHNSGSETENKRREIIKSIAGAVLVLIELAVPVAVLVLVVLSAIVSLSG